MRTGLIILYLAALIAANLIVKHFGAYGLWFSSVILIPFDFVCRCIFHENWKGIKLVKNLILLTLASGLITVLLNYDALNIALASFAGIAAVQIGAGLFYQRFKNKSLFFKVNLSDLVAIVIDSIVFQYVAFQIIDFEVTGGQILIKFIGGLFWFFIIFKVLKFNINGK